MPTPIATFYAQESPQGTAAITTASISVTNGQILVVKLATWDSATAMGAPTGGSQTYISRVVEAPGGFNQWCGIYSCTISGSPGSMTVSSTPAASARCSMLVEQWPAGSLAGSPVTASSTGVAAPVAGTITPSAGTSAISWVGGDAGSADPASRTYVNSGTDEGVRDDHVGSNGVDYYGYQQATGTSSQSYGLTLPGSTTFVIAGIEILSASSTPIVDPTWAPHRLVPPGRISPAGFWVPWSGDLVVNATAQSSPAATEATGTGSALDAAVAVGVNAAEATGSGSALDAVAGVAVSAVEAAGTGTAQDAAAAIGVNAAEATGAGTAADAVASVAAQPTSADGTGTAYDATVSTSGSTNAPATEATGAGTAYDATAALGVSAGAATATGSAADASVATTANAAEATAAGSAPDAQAAIAVLAGAATGTGTAYDATVSTATQTNAPAAEATGAGAAYDATIAITTLAGVAAAAAAAYDATVVLGAPGSAFADVAAGTGTAYDARVRKIIPRPNTGIITRPYAGTILRP